MWRDVKGGGIIWRKIYGGDEKDVREVSLRGTFLHIRKKKGLENSPRLERTPRNLNTQSKISLTDITDGDYVKMVMDALAMRNHDRSHGSL
jgi:hypothetical protein